MYQLDCRFWSQKFHSALLVWRHECNRNGPFYPIISERIKFQFFLVSECLHNNSILIKNEIKLSKIKILFFQKYFQYKIEKPECSDDEDDDDFQVKKDLTDDPAERKQESTYYVKWGLNIIRIQNLF